MEMRELREISKAYYDAGSSEVQNLAREFFNLMDTDGDNKVNCEEFFTFMRNEGYSQFRNLHFFEVLDMDNNGTLDFDEVKMLYYVVKSGRPFCDCCGNFISGVYFACVECFRNPKSLFRLCPECYRHKKSDHKNVGHTQFLDNYTLLEATRNMALAEANERRGTSSNAIVSVPHSSNTHMKSPLLPTYNANYHTMHPPQYPGHNYRATAHGSNYSNQAAWHVSNMPHYSTPHAWVAESSMVNRPSYPHAYQSYSNTCVPEPGYSTPTPWPVSNSFIVPNYSNAIVPSPNNSNPFIVPNYSNAIVPSPNNSNPTAPLANMDKWRVALHAFEVAVAVGAISASLCTIL